MNDVSSINHVQDGLDHTGGIVSTVRDDPVHSPILEVQCDTMITVVKCMKSYKRTHVARCRDNDFPSIHTRTDRRIRICKYRGSRQISTCACAPLPLDPKTHRAIPSAFR